MNNEIFKVIDHNTFEWPRITAETPLSEIKRIHKLIWDCVIEKGGKPETPYRFDCVLCEYAIFSKCYHRFSHKNYCYFCSAKWPNDIGCIFENSLYKRWIKTGDPEFAKQIRDIPFYF